MTAAGLVSAIAMAAWADPAPAEPEPVPPESAPPDSLRPGGASKDPSTRARPPGDAIEPRDPDVLGPEARQARAPWAVPLDAGRPEPWRRWDRDSLVETPDRGLREVLPWFAEFSVMRSGSHFTPDPFDWGDLPGREPPVTLLGGLSMTPPGMPEGAPDAVPPSWVDGLSLYAPNPLRLPNNPTGGSILEWELLRPDTTVAVSGVRLSDGSNDTNSNELYFVRPSGPNLFYLLWSDHKTAGRDVYSRADGQNLLLRYERNLGTTRVALSVQDHYDRVKIFPSNRWLWDRNSWDLRLQARVEGWDVDASTSASWHRFGWEGAPGSITRKSTLYQTVVRAAGPGTLFRPRVSVQFDVHRQRFWAPGRLSEDRWDRGLGLAAGGSGVSKGWRYEASIGISSPGQERYDWVAAAEAERSLGGGWAVQGTASRMVRTSLVPHYANHLSTYVGQGFLVPDVDPDPELESVATASLRLERSGESSHLAAAVRTTRIGNTVSGGDGALFFFVPAGLPLLPESALGADLGVVSLRVEAGRSLPLGLRLDGWATVRASDPGWEEQLWMTPAETRVRASWRQVFFAGDLDFELFGRAHAAAERATTLGNLEPRVRFDGGVAGRIGAAYLWAMLLNLQDSLHAAASVEGGFGVLPRRSFRMGLSWRFLD